MIIFLCGSDSYRSRQKLNALIEQFKKQRDPRGNNVVKIDGDKTSIDEINGKIASGSLLAEKRLLIVEELFSHREENIFKALLDYLQKLEKRGNENSLIFYEPKELESKKYGAKKLTAARKKLFDYLKTQKFSEQFNPLNNSQLSTWIKQYTDKKNIILAPTTVASLINTAGNDLWVLHNELDKLVNFTVGNKRLEITTDDIRQLASSGAAEENIFALTDALGNKNKALFFLLLENQLEAGVSLQQILALVSRQFKIILQVKEQVMAGQAQGQIASALKLHPFVVQKTVPQTRNFSLDYLKNILQNLTKLDYKIKTGQNDGLTGLTLLFAINS
ncbi:DNA polymerase III subunit delta [Candidatus Falkowbacteria bacterium CG10_big_fil_rev_8_21_14_0_10_43_11]|uniref:DNA polymerase III subunit delta n=1 Tax=Candidatus Falkowbacteria bacterium CG10_big_fil_rev_8_21_14_0_10_43_11 TaxID=1974568 RepID=A0A2M6WLR4_9BACT|nr:MAG: DNA polymerase III subunit delta [Candidatus Falkowbacteria bacterium CG10_big_fil_rev_8_21_14_0_10_43_11]